MPDAILQRPRTHATTSRTASALPAELLEQVRPRLRLVAAALGGFFVLLTVLVSTLRLALGVAPIPDRVIVMRIAMSAGLAALSLVMVLVTRSARLTERRLSDLGLAYQVAVALGISMVRFSVEIPPHFLPFGVSAVTLVLLLFPLVVPSTLPRTLLATLAAASMDPVGLFLAHLGGYPLPSLGVALPLILPTYLCGTLVLVPVLVLRRLGRAVHDARELGSYQLVERLGEGGMGEVWRATHRMLARPAAVKLIRPDALARDAERAATILARFEREAQATAGLRSPHSIQLYDFGRAADGSFYYVMELLDGLDLDELVGRFGPLPPARVVRVLAQACDSLDDAHRSGLVHRDVKPANLFLCRYGHRSDFVKVLDFGLVKLAADEAPQPTDSKLTAEDTTTGTPAFMPPELATGEPVDGRADLYGLGCVAYYLLTGQLVFEAKTSRQMVIEHVRTTPVAPSTRIETPVPAALDALVLGCLAKAPGDRPADAATLRRALLALEQELDEPWTDDDAEAWWSTNLPHLVTTRPRLVSTDDAR